MPGLWAGRVAHGSLVRARLPEVFSAIRPPRTVPVRGYVRQSPRGYRHYSLIRQSPLGHSPKIINADEHTLPRAVETR